MRDRLVRFRVGAFFAALSLGLAAAAGLCPESGRAADDVRRPSWPAPPAIGRTAFVVVTLGAVPPGTQIDVDVVGGRRIGRISPFAIRPGNAAGTYSLPFTVEEGEARAPAFRLSLPRADGGSEPPPPGWVVELRLLGTSISAP